MTRWARLPLILVLTMLTMPFQGCGKNSPSTPTDGATITMSPTTITSSISSETYYNITVIARYQDGTPYPNAMLNISGAFAEPRNATNTNARYQFYAYPGGNLNTGNVKVDNGFTAYTDNFGTYNFSIVVYGTVGNFTNSFKDSINVISGSAFGSLGVSIN